MNIKEFDALAVGDRVRNGEGHEAEVVSRTEAAVTIRWSGPQANSAAGGPTFALYRVGNNWWPLDVVTVRTEQGVIHGSIGEARRMTWVKIEYPPRDCTAGPCTRDDCRRADQCLGGDYDKIAAGGTYK